MQRKIEFIRMRSLQSKVIHFTFSNSISNYLVPLHPEMLSSATRSWAKRSSRLLIPHTRSLPALSQHPVLSAARSLSTNSSSTTSTPAYDGHIPLNWFENAFLAVGSGLVLLRDPYRAGTSSLPFPSILIKLPTNTFSFEIPQIW